jgi:hypothetical protein
MMKIPLVLLAAANTISAEVTFDISSEYVSYIQNNVCATNECLGWCADGVIDVDNNCDSCKVDCSITYCASACEDSNGGSSEAQTECPGICCDDIATDPTACDDLLATAAPTEAPPVIDDDTTIFADDDDDDAGTDDATDEGGDDDGYAPDCRCVRAEDFPEWKYVLFFYSFLAKKTLSWP